MTVLYTAGIFYIELQYVPWSLYITVVDILHECISKCSVQVRPHPLHHIAACEGVSKQVGKVTI